MRYAKEMSSTKFVEKLIKYDFIWWYLLLLPNGKWATLWCQGLDHNGDSTYFTDSIMDGDYERACAFIGNKDEAIQNILDSLQKMNLEDPLNNKFQIERIRKKLSVTDISEKSKPMRLPDRFWRRPD